MKIRSAVPKNGCLIANHQHSPFARRRHDFRQAAGRRHDVSNSISPVSFGKSFMKIRSAVPENGCLIFFADEKNKKKNKKTSVKHIRYRLIGGCVNECAICVLIYDIIDIHTVNCVFCTPAANPATPVMTNCAHTYTKYCTVGIKHKLLSTHTQLTRVVARVW